MSRYLMKPIQVQEEELRCAHAKIWPPPQLHLIPKPLGLDVEYLRFRVPDDVYLRVKTWQGVCGLTQMNPEKCLSCPHSLKDSEETPLRQHGLPPRSLRVSPVAKSKDSLPGPNEKGPPTRKSGVPQTQRVRDYLSLESRKRSIPENHPDLGPINQKLEILLRSMDPAERRTLKVVRGL